MKALHQAYAGRSVFLTGHTGFKGGWLCTWLSMLGAKVTGYAMPPPTNPSFFDVCNVRDVVNLHVQADIRDSRRLEEALAEAQPDVVFHLAAQPLVRRSYVDPVETLDVNVTGTARVLEAVRALGRPCAVVVVTSDKCYANRNWLWGYRETDELGGADPYSMSKGAAELVVDCWRRSYFSKAGQVRVATARAGNVIGGGDWAEDRIITDCVASLKNKAPVVLRNPLATRPWQHVLEPLSGYLWLGKKLMDTADGTFAEAWNFGPAPTSVRPVRSLVESFIARWGEGEWKLAEDADAPHEAMSLALVSEKALHRLDWRPTWDFEQSVDATVHWYRAWLESSDVGRVSRQQIEAYVQEARRKNVAWAVQ